MRYRFFVYMVSSQKLLEHVLSKKAYELPELNTFKPRKTTKSSTLLIRQRFQGYHFESSMCFFYLFPFVMYDETKLFKLFSPLRVPCIQYSMLENVKTEIEYRKYMWGPGGKVCL